MKRCLLLPLVFASASVAQASPQIPDSKLVTSISEAAKLCELSEAGIDWSEKSAKILAISLTPGDLQPPAPKMELLKACIFTWAYDREVTLDISMKQ